jgi:transcriptional regulator with XRE-family HTH domain
MKNSMSVKEILAKNLREHRRRRGLTQENLAEAAGISTQYLAMIEIARRFPAPDLLERLAEVLDINVYELFLIDHSPREELENLRRDIITEMENTFTGILDHALSQRAAP